MVSVERTAYFEKLKPDPAAGALVRFLFESNVIVPNRVRPSNAKHLTNVALHSIKTNSKADFEKYLLELQKRKIAFDSDWIHDDFLIFAFCIGVRKYSCSTDFLNEACESRSKTETPSRRTITNAFIRLLRSDLNELKPETPVEFTALSYLSDNLVSEECLNSIYKQSIAVLSTPPESHLQFLTALKAFDLVVINKGLDENVVNQKTFIIVFEKRIKQISRLAYLLVFLFTGALWAVVNGNSLFGLLESDGIFKIIKDNGLVAAPVTAFLLQKRIESFAAKALTSFWGYSNGFKDAILE